MSAPAKKLINRMEIAVGSSFFKGPGETIIAVTKAGNESIVDELRLIRERYDGMEIVESDAGNADPEAGKRWKAVRNVISDRIEELTGDRV